MTLHRDAATEAPPRGLDPFIAGTAWILVSAAAYTASNIYLRRVAVGTDPVWISCLKAIPVTLVASLVVGYHELRGLRLIPPRHLVWLLVAVSLLMQLGGNVGFQFALGRVGLALTVPLTFGTIISSGALMGRIWLGEAITLRTLAAMVILTVAICLLSAGAGTAHRTIHALEYHTASGAVILAVIWACVSGIAYAAGSVVIRRVVTHNSSVWVTLWLISLTGLVALGILSLWTSGPQAMLKTSPRVLGNMLLAGGFNLVAFYAFTSGLKYISVIHANALNSAQIAMAAVGGIFLFGEAPTWPLIAGVALTVGGLMLMQLSQAKTPGSHRHIGSIEGEDATPPEAVLAAEMPMAPCPHEWADDPVAESRPR